MKLHVLFLKKGYNKKNNPPSKVITSTYFIRMNKNPQINQNNVNNFQIMA